MSKGSLWNRWKTNRCCNLDKQFVKLYKHILQFGQMPNLYQVWQLDEQGEPLGLMKNLSNIFPGLPKVFSSPFLLYSWYYHVEYSTYKLNTKMCGKSSFIASRMILSFPRCVCLQEPDAGFTWHNGLTFIFKGTLTKFLNLGFKISKL